MLFQVDSRIQIAVHHITALAHQYTVAQIHRVNHAARVSGLATREEAINHMKAGAGHRRLVFKLAAKLCKPGIRNAACEMMVAEHACHVEVFDGDGVVLGRKRVGQLMQRIHSDALNAQVQTCQLGFRFGAVDTSLLLASKTAGQTDESLVRGSMGLQRRHDQPIAEGCEFLDTKIDADAPAIKRATQAVVRIHQ